MQPHISLAAEKVGSIFGLPVTNSTLMTWLVMLILTLFALASTRNISLIPSKLQTVSEVIIDGLYTLFKSVVGEDKIDRFFPLLATIFLFIIVGNWSGLLPGVGSIGLTQENAQEEHALVVAHSFASEPETVVEKTPLEAKTSRTIPETQTLEQKSEQATFVPLLRGPTADLNTTLAMALFAVGSLQYYGFATLGLSYLKKYINLSNPIMFFVGILEIISDLAKIVSFAFRLFGNIFAGEVLLAVIAFLMPVIAPLPFLGLELFVGFIQALVFSMLTAVFLNMATMSHEEH